MANFERIVNKVLMNEGGYVNDPTDKGGETNFGISKRVYPHVNIKNLSKNQAKAIYKKDYWDEIKGNDIVSDEVAYEIFDTAVNMGVRTSSKLVQIAINVYPDGDIGQKTLKAINTTNEELLIAKFKLAKIARYVYLVRKRPKNQKYLYGWLNRSFERL